MSYTPKYPEYGKKISSSELQSLSLVEYLARGINGEAGYSDQHDDKKAVAKVFYNRKQSDRTKEFGSNYRIIAYKALDALKNPNTNVLNPRKDDISSESFDEAVDAAKALVEDNVSYLDINIKDFCFFVDKSLLKKFEAKKVVDENGNVLFLYFFNNKMLREKYIYLDRLIFFTYDGY